MPSTVIRRFAYHPAEQRLEVLFTTGTLYSYYGVQSDVAQAMRQSASKGRFFNAFIRDRYPFTRDVPTATKKEIYKNRLRDNELDAGYGRVPPFTE
jgi:hypothetical protein